MFEHISAESVETVLKIVLAVIGVGVAVLIMRLKEVFVTKAHFHEFREKHAEDHQHIDQRHEDTVKRLDDGAKQFAIIQADIAHLPNHKDISDLKDRISGVEGSVKVLATSIDGLREILQRVERPLNRLVDNHMKVGS